MPAGERRIATVASFYLIATGSTRARLILMDARARESRRNFYLGDVDFDLFGFGVLILG